MNEDLKAELSIPFANANYAQIAFNSLKVDKEPRKDLIKKKLSVDDKHLKVSWSAKEARILRVSIQSFFDHLSLVLKTIDQFALAN